MFFDVPKMLDIDLLSHRHHKSVRMNHVGLYQVWIGTSYNPLEKNLTEQMPHPIPNAMLNKTDARVKSEKRKPERADMETISQYCVGDRGQGRHVQESTQM